MGLNCPSMCLNESEKCDKAANIYILLINVMILGDGVTEESQIWVMGLLSVTTTTLFPLQERPHVKTAARMANNSLKSISSSWK